METKAYVQQARRLEAYVNKHGCPEAYSEFLEALAAMHGAKDWNTLVGTRKATSAASESAVVEEVRLTKIQRQRLIEALLDELDQSMDLNDMLAHRRGLLQEGCPGFENLTDSELCDLASDGVQLPSSTLDELGLDDETAKPVVWNDDEVAEWVGLHYRVNFSAEAPTRQAEWRERYRESQLESLGLL